VCFESISECSLLAHPLLMINNLIDTTKGMATRRAPQNPSRACECGWLAHVPREWQGRQLEERLAAGRNDGLPRGCHRSSHRWLPPCLPKDLASTAVPLRAQWAEND